MYLKKIEIYGFKSFGTKTEINFDHKITGIVGPNGSGKSNIVDAIKWVLGEQRVKQLRGDKMEDVIFSGTIEKKSLGYAQVSIIIDNSNKMLPIDYDEVNVARRLYRSGESEYYINKSQVRLKDVQELFMDTGLGKGGYSITSQGQIGNIVNNSAYERKLLIEEAVGIVKYKTRKLEALRKLEKTQNDLYRIGDILSDLSQRLPSLRRQSEKARTFLDIRDELKEIEINLFVHKYEELNEKLNTSLADEKAINDQLLDMNEESVLLDMRYKSLRENLNNLDERILKSREDIDQLNKNYDNSKIEIEVNKNSIENYIRNKERIESEISKADDANKLDLENKAEYENKINNIEEEIEKIGKESALLKKEVQLLLEKTQESSLYIKSIEKQKTLKEKLYREKAKEAENKKEQAKARVFLIDKLKEDKKENEKQLFEEEQQQSLLISNENMDFKKIEEKLSLLVKEKELKEKEYSEYQQNLLALYNKIELKSSHLKALRGYEEQREGYSYAVKQLMEAKKRDNILNNDIYGVVSDIIKVEDKYIEAIQKALGASLNNIVVKNERTAQRAIELLKRNKWGRITFLPHNIINGNVFDDSNINLGIGYIGIASKLVKVEGKFKNVADNLLGRVYVFDTLENATFFSQKNGYKYKIVTLDGEVIFPGGAMVGGKAKHDEGGILKRKNEIEKDEKEIIILKDNYEEEIAKGKEYKSKIEKIQENISIYQDIYNKEKAVNIANIEKQTFIKNKINTIKNNIIKYTEEIKSHEEMILLLNDEEKKLNEEIESIFLEIKEINDEISKVNTGIYQEEYVKKADEYNEVKIALSNLDSDKKHFVQILSEVEDKLYIRNNEISEKKNDIEIINENISSLQEQIRICIAIDKDYEYQKENLEKINAKLIIERNKSNDEYMIVSDKLNKVLVDKNEITEILGKKQVEKEKYSSELEYLQKDIFENYSLTYMSALEYKKPLAEKNKAIQKVAELKEKIRKLGHINIDSLEEYKEVKEKHDFLEKQMNDLNESRENLTKIIKDITADIEHRFLREFSLIQEEFNNVFNKLFEGGSAKLVLTDPENIEESGVDISVQLPKKGLKNISLISGGEQTMTGIALIFAILSIKPAPFTVLDEIDAALDDANIQRFCQYLYSIKNNNQFVIVTHRKQTMEIADVLYGATMGSQGITHLVSIALNDVKEGGELIG